MKGSLQELGDGHWRLRVFPGREGGKVRQVSRNFKGTKRQAESALAKLVADVERQQVAIGYAGTLGELIERWLDDIAAHRSAYTIREYRRVFTNAIKPALGGLRIDKLSGRLMRSKLPRSKRAGPSRPIASARRRATVSPAGAGSIPTSAAPDCSATHSPGPPAPQATSTSTSPSSRVRKLMWAKASGKSPP